MSAVSSTSKQPAGKPSNEAAIIAGFNQLRQDQRAMSAKITELETDESEHSLVLDALKEGDGDRKCFRLVGGVLVERTVKEVVPPLQKNKEMLTQLVATLKEQVEKKGREIN